MTELTPDVVERAVLIYDLAAAYQGLDQAEYRALSILSSIARKKPLNAGHNSPAMTWIKRNNPPLYERLMQYEEKHSND